MFILKQPYLPCIVQDSAQIITMANTKKPGERETASNNEGVLCSSKKSRVISERNLREYCISVFMMDRSRLIKYYINKYKNN